MKLSKWGALGAALFILYSLYFIALKLNGAWQAPIFIFLATYPFSALINNIVDHYQSVYLWPDTLRSNIELSAAVAFGVFEFYAIGLFAGKLFGSGRKDS